MSSTNDRGATTRRWMTALTLTALLAVPALSAQQTPARAGSVRVQCVNCGSTDSAVLAARERQAKLALRFDSLRAEFEQKRLSDHQREALVLEMSLALRAMQEALGERRAFTTRVEPSRRTLEAEAVRVGQAPLTVVRTEHVKPGYLGVSFDGVNYERTTDKEHIIRFYQYPKIALVEPASPAERAGIKQGDTLVALNDMDVVLSGEISLTKILVPEHRLNVLVRRDGGMKTVPVTVGRAPDYVVRRMSPAYTPTPAPDARTRSGQSTPRSSASVSARGSSVFVFADGVGGARIEPITDGLGRALGVSSGVLVMSAPEGTPAYESGLRDGDVIRRVAGRDVTSVRELREILGQNRGESVRVTIVRARKTREVTLHW